MADILPNGTCTDANHNSLVDDNVLLKFQRYRDRLRVLGAEGKLDELVAHYDMYAQSFGKVRKLNVQIVVGYRWVMFQTP